MKCMKNKELIVLVVVAVLVAAAVLKWKTSSSAPWTGTTAPPSVASAISGPVRATAPGGAAKSKDTTTRSTGTTATADVGQAPSAVVGIVPADGFSRSEAADETPEPALADISTGKAQDMNLAANSSGNFPRVLIDRQGVVPVVVTYSDAVAGSPVELIVLDGGTLDGRDPARVMNLDGQKQLRFAFHASDMPGLFRIFLRHGGMTKTLNFWAGQPLAIAATPLPK